MCFFCTQTLRETCVFARTTQDEKALIVISVVCVVIAVATENQLMVTERKVSVGRTTGRKADTAAKPEKVVQVRSEQAVLEDQVHAPL